MNRRLKSPPPHTAPISRGSREAMTITTGRAPSYCRFLAADPMRIFRVRMCQMSEHLDWMKFAKAHASVWLDNKLVYSRDLYSTTKPRMLVFRRRSHAHISEMVQLPAGKHRMRVRLQSVSDAFDETKAFPATLKPNSESTLRIDVNKKNKQLQIELKNL